MGKRTWEAKKKTKKLEGIIEWVERRRRRRSAIINVINDKNWQVGTNHWKHYIWQKAWLSSTHTCYLKGRRHSWPTTPFPSLLVRAVLALVFESLDDYPRITFQDNWRETTAFFSKPDCLRLPLHARPVITSRLLFLMMVPKPVRDTLSGIWHHRNSPWPIAEGELSISWWTFLWL